MDRIVGIGVDQIEIDRVLRACEKKGFLQKYFSRDEQGMIHRRKKCAATNFAGKEAVAKALGTGFSGVSPGDIEILRRENGSPYVRLSGNAKRLSENKGIYRMHISLSDSKAMAVAFAIAIADEGKELK